MLKTAIISNAMFKRSIKSINYDLSLHKDLDIVKFELSEIAFENVIDFKNTIDYYLENNHLDSYVYDFNFLAENKSKSVNLIRLSDEDNDKLVNLCYIYDILYRTLNEAIDSYNAFNDDSMSYHLSAASSRITDAILLQRDAVDIFESCSVVKYYYQFK